MLFIHSTYFTVSAHFQNGRISDEFANEMDVFKATDTQQDGSPHVLLAVSKNNVYDGYIGQEFPNDLKRSFIAIRKKNSDEVRTTAAMPKFDLLFHVFK